MRISEVMTSRVRTLREDESTELASAVLRFWNYRHLPVLDAAGRVVGMLTPIDLLEAIHTRGTAARIVASEVMRRPVLTIRADEDLEMAFAEMRRAGVHALPVVDHTDRLVGIVTDVDILVALASGQPRAID